MPRLDDELVLGFHIAEHDHFVVCDFRSGHDFSYRWHPSTNQSVEAPLTCLLTVVRKVLHRMVRARASVGKNWHGIETLFGSDKCVRSDDELVLGFHIAEHDHFVVCDFRSGHDFSYRWHPSTNQSVEAPLTCLLTVVRKVLHRMVRARASVGKNWHGIETLFGSDKCV